jgi:hypothetical protein
MKNDDLDRFLSSSLEKNELEIPPEVQENVRRRMAALANQPRRSTWRWMKIWLPLLAAAILVLVVSLPLLFPPRPEIKKISQIRTEFNIPEKNIKIVWMQRDDFHLPEKNG